MNQRKQRRVASWGSKIETDGLRLVRPINNNLLSKMQLGGQGKGGVGQHYRSTKQDGLRFYPGPGAPCASNCLLIFPN